MARDYVAHVAITGLEPFSRFIGRAAQAAASFYAMSAEEVKALPDLAVTGVAELQSAFRELGYSMDGQPASGGDGQDGD